MGLLGISKKGKWIIGGVCAFAIVATATTGLAAWVIGQQDSKEANGNISVAEVNNQSVTLALTENETYNVVFGPKTIEGGNQVIGNDGVKADEEKLEVTITGTATLLNENTNFEISATTKLNSTDENITKLVDVKGGTKSTALVELPGETKATITGTGLLRNFSIKLEFGWGTALTKDGKKVNPCEYYDGTAGKGYTEAVECLNKLKTLNTIPAPSFTVTLATSLVA